MRPNDEGLMAKYIVHKAKTGETVNNCFVLRPDRDAAAVAAIRTYAAATKNRTLAADLIQWVGPEPNDPLTLEELREMGGEPYCHVGLQDDSPPPHWSILDPCFAWHIEDYGYGKRWLAYRRKPEEGTK